jgi:4-hydroxy-4-methyl-2-oxoglutarate aldolase
MGKRGQMNHEIKPIDSDMKVCGSAITVDSPAADNLTLHKAIEVAAEGDVLVVDAKGNKEAGGMWGEIMTTAAQTKGIRGIIIDGAVRDARALLELKFPTFASAISPGGTVKKTLGSINTSIVCGGVAVHPGDVVVGDADGVVVVPRNIAENLITKAEERENAETEIKKRLRMGETTMKIYGFDQLLAGKNIEQRRS